MTSLKNVASFCAVVGLVAGSVSATTTAFSFTASAQSWIAGGYTYFSTSSGGNWSFSASILGGNTVKLMAAQTAGGGGSWVLFMAAPNGQRITPGFYDGATRWPSQPSGTSGMALWGNGRAGNQLTGCFNVLQADYGSDNTVTAFAVDFTQYDGGNPDAWLNGEFLFNALIPEPSGLAIFALASLLAIRRR